MRRWLAGMALIWATLAAPLHAQQNPVVVELFTSQGCSSCPPADALLAELGQYDHVIPLALHVDYWDYIGWKDRFAQPHFTKRQKGYAQANGWNRVYTPQMVIGGTSDVIGSHAMKVMNQIQRHAEAPATIELSITREGDNARIRAVALVPGLPPCEIHLVRFAPEKHIDITRGENAGRSFTYTHVVQSWEVAARWDGDGSFEATVPIAGNAGTVVLVQSPGYGPILAAARLR